MIRKTSAGKYSNVKVLRYNNRVEIRVPVDIANVLDAGAHIPRVGQHLGSFVAHVLPVDVAQKFSAVKTVRRIWVVLPGLA